MIINVRKELEDHISTLKSSDNKPKEILFAIISYEKIDGASRLFILKPNHSMQLYHTFLEFLDLTYDTKTHLLQGFIMYKDDGFSEKYANVYDKWFYNQRIAFKNPEFDSTVRFFKIDKNIEEEIIFGTKLPEILINEKVPLTLYGKVQELRKILREYLRDYNLVCEYNDSDYEDESYYESYDELDDIRDIENQCNVKYYLRYLDDKIKDTLKELREQMEKLED